MELARLLHTQGFGTRRECTALVRAGQVEVDARVVDDPGANIEPAGRVLCVRGEPWPVHLPAIVMLHKPAGYECSAAPSAHPSVLSLLPPPLRTRGVQPVGRLDADTTGLLLLTDDGALAHRLIHPRRHVPKVYEVRIKHALAHDTVDRLLAGVVLRDDPAPVRALACEATGERSLRLTLGEGRYHQVKRMLAAVGNRVESLHRSGFGALRLPAELAPGQWRWIERAEDITG